jgi:5'-nucleotidase
VRVLVTNDDGVDAPGLVELALAACEADFEVFVAAPREESSGSSCALSAVQEGGRTVFDRRHLPRLGDDVPVFAVAAAPSMISLLALRGAFGDRPDIVASGVNDAPNTGRAVIHSGTVGAALTAATYGARGLAVSIELGEPKCWESAHVMAGRCLRWLADAPPTTMLNLNVPNVGLGELAGLRVATLAPFGTVQAQVAEVGQSHVKLAYSEPSEEAPPGSDAALLAKGFATVTSLQPVAEADAIHLDGLLD